MATSESTFRQIQAAKSYGAISTIAYSATPTLDAANGNRQRITLTGNATFTFSNFSAGQSVLLMVRQDATGSRTITWPTIRWSGGTAPTLTTTGSKEDHIMLFYDGTDYFGSVAGQNY